MKGQKHGGGGQAAGKKEAERGRECRRTQAMYGHRAEGCLQ